MLPSWCDETITVKRPALVDSRGTKVKDWTNATTRTVAGCSVQAGETSMDLDGRTETTLGGAVYAPPGADIKAGDRIIAAAGTFEVSGEPMPWKSPTGRVSHVRANIQRWRG